MNSSALQRSELRCNTQSCAKLGAELRAALQRSSTKKATTAARRLFLCGAAQQRLVLFFLLRCAAALQRFFFLFSCCCAIELPSPSYMVGIFFSLLLFML